MHNSSSVSCAPGLPCLLTCLLCSWATDLGSLLQAITGLSNTDVEHQLGHADFPHGVPCLGLVLQAQDSIISCPKYALDPDYFVGMAPSIEGARCSENGAKAGGLMGSS